MLAISLLALALPLQGAPKSSDLFLPYFEQTSKPTSEWLARFEGSGGTDQDALWCLFWKDDRSEAVIAALKTALARCPDPGAKLAIDTVLDQWEVAHDCVPSDADSELDRWPFPLLDGDDAAVEASLAMDDRTIRARAALTLVARRRSVDAAVRALVDTVLADSKGTWPGTPWYAWSRTGGDDAIDAPGVALAFVRAFAGSAFDRAAAKLVERSKDDPDRLRFLLRQVRLATSPPPPDVTQVLAPIAAGTDRNALRALRLLAATRSIEPWAVLDSHSDFHAPWNLEPLADTGGEPAVAKALGAAVRAAVGAGTLEATDVRGLAAIGLRSAAVRAAIVPALEPLLKRDDAVGAEALFVLTHLGDAGEAVRGKYLQVLGDWKAFDAAGLEWLPCLAEHDARTLEAFERIFDKAESKRPLMYPLAAAGWKDERRSARVKRFVDAIEPTDFWTWYQLFELGFAVERAPADSDPVYMKVHKLALAIRSKRARGAAAGADENALRKLVIEGEEPQGEFGYADAYTWGIDRIVKLGLADDAFVQWGAEFMLDADHFHQENVAQALAERVLDRRTQAVLCHLGDIFGDDRMQYVQLYGHLGVAGIEKAATIRKAARAGNLKAIEALASVARLGKPEEEVLVALVQRGLRDRRLDALKVIRQNRIAGSLVTAAVADARNDLDDAVRSAAAQAYAATAK